MVVTVALALSGVLALGAGPDPAPVGADGPAAVAAEGDLMAFGPSAADRSGVEVHVVEDPTLTATTDATGHWRIDGLVAGSTATFALDGPGWYPIQTATFTVPAGGLDHVSIQAPSTDLVGTLESFLGVVSEPDRCHLATTVTRAGYSLYGGAPDGTHGEPGATVTIDPVPAGGATPIYWNGARFDTIWPDRSLRATTADGGVLFVNVPPGTYTLQAHEAGVTFRPTTVSCRAGVLTNASPPWGIQALSGGLGPDDTVPFPGATRPAEPVATTATFTG